MVRAAPAADRDQRRRARSSDFSLGAIFSICCLALPAGTVRDIFFQLAFAGYVGAFFNLNPFIERDGYHMLVDWLREPGLRRRAREQFARRLSGGGRVERLAGARALLALGARLVGARGRLRDRDVAALRADHDRARAGLGRPRRAWARCGSRSSCPVLVVVGKPLLRAAARPCGNMSRGRR